MTAEGLMSLVVWVLVIAWAIVGLNFAALVVTSWMEGKLMRIPLRITLNTPIRIVNRVKFEEEAKEPGAIIEMSDEERQ